MKNGYWKMENGNWKMEIGKWKMEIGKWKLENGKWIVLSSFLMYFSLLKISYMLTQRKICSPPLPPKAAAAY